MGLPARRLATYDDLWSVPDTVVGEIIAGDLVVSPRPAPRHSYAIGELHGELRGPFHKGRGGPGGWLILTEPELHLSGDALIPDIAGWRRGRWPVAHEAAVEIAPDWVCEVLSPRTEVRDRGDKARAYAREGISHYWLLNPILRTLEVWRLEGGRWVVLDFFQASDLAHAEPFEAFALDLSALWLDPASASHDPQVQVRRGPAVAPARQV